MFANIDMKNFMRSIVDTMQEGLILVDPEGQIIFANKTLEKLLGYTNEELKGKKCSLFQCDNCFPEPTNLLNKNCSLFKEETINNRKCTFLNKDNKPIHLLVSGSLIRDRNGAVIGGIESLIDMSTVIDQKRVISNLRQRLRFKEGFQGIIGNSSSIQEMLELSMSAAQSDAPLIIYGEPGTGKELLANVIHENSQRKDYPFVKVNCAALNENLLESELFGHVKGAFTGAEYARTGKFESAHGGNIFLDEIGDLPSGTQTKLLRFFQDKEIERVGDHQPIKIDVRIIASTHKDLQKLIRDGLFREDLYYRINVLPIPMPSLQERKSDIPLLVETFIKRLADRTGKAITSISREAMGVLIDHPWPGNIRQLVNTLEYAFVLCTESQIALNHLPVTLIQPKDSSNSQKNVANPRKRQQEIQKKQLLDALSASGGNQTKAAEILGVSRVTIWKRMKKFKIQR